MVRASSSPQPSEGLSPEAAVKASLANGRLALFLGAGVSVGSDLPSWDNLVAAVYMASLAEGDPSREIRRAYRNYLRSIADWQLKRIEEPLQITAQKARLALSTQTTAFIGMLRQVLYSSMIGPMGDPSPRAEIDDALRKNRTLTAVAELCESRPTGRVQRVITYNYDNLLELELKRRSVKASSVWEATRKARHLPIYHVHGMISLARRGPHSDDTSIVFTEEQYHRATHNPYSWSNLVQLNTMAEFTGLTVGLSLSDPNMRRLLAAAKQTPSPPNLYALMVKPPPPRLLKSDLNAIHLGAKRHLNSFTRTSRMKNPDKEFSQVQEIMLAVHKRDHEMEEETLCSLGVTPIWVDSVAEVAERLRQLRGESVS